MVLLIFTYLYFWWMVVKASAHRHVSREKVTNGKLTASLAHAKRKGNTHRFLIQITTKGGALRAKRVQHRAARSRPQQAIVVKNGCQKAVTPSNAKKRKQRRTADQQGSMRQNFLEGPVGLEPTTPCLKG